VTGAPPDFEAPGKVAVLAFSHGRSRKLLLKASRQFRRLGKDRAQGRSFKFGERHAARYHGTAGRANVRSGSSAETLA
jgi:hypothetical protein